MKKIWGFKLNIYNICLIIFMAAINIVLNHVAQYLNDSSVPMPLWLDSVGTFITAMEAGPLAGALAGFPVYGIYLFTRPDWALFSLNSVLIGISAGVLARTIGLTNWRNVLIAGIAAALIDIVLSSALDMRFYDGLTGFILGDSVFNYFSRTQPVIVSSLAAETVMSAPDKIFSAFLAYLICSDSLTKRNTRQC